MPRISFRFFVAAMLVLAPLTVPCRAAEPIEVPAGAVAKVNDKVLTEADLEEELGLIIPAQVFHRSMTPEKKATFVPQAIEAMIERELLYQEAQKRGMKADPKRIKEAKNAAIERFGGKKKFKEALKQSGLTEKDYEGEVERRFLAEDLKKTEVEQKADVTREEIEAYYERNKSGFVRPEARRIRHILIKVDPSSSDEDKGRKRAQAEDVAKKAHSGEDFARLAWDYSEDPYKVKSGDLGLLHRGRLDPALDDIAFGLEVGGISNVVETIYGFHVMKVEEKKEPEQLGLEDVYQKIEGQLKEKKLKARREEFIGGLRRAAKVEIYR